MKKVLITASVYGFIGSFEKSNISILLEQDYEVHVATNMSKELKAFGDTGQLEGINVIKHQISYSRSPLSLQTLKSYKTIKKLIKEENFDLIHCHTPVAAMLIRLAARKTRKTGTKVIYTAHGFHFFKGAPILNWLIYFPVEFLCSFFTDILITINQEDYKLAQKIMRAKRIEYIAGVGIDVSKFSNSSINKEKKRNELGVSQKDFIILSVGELNSNKNHETIIECIHNLKYNNIHYLIAGQGELEEYLKSKIESLNLEKRIHLLGFRTDVEELYQISDLFCFPSKREGLGLAALEAMASGVPLLTSNIHGINDYLIQNKTGFSCPPKDTNAFCEKIEYLYLNKSLRDRIGEYNKEAVKVFDKKEIIKKMRDIYNNLNIDRS